MNQAIIINDDHEYHHENKYWQCTAMLSGEKIIIKIASEILPEQLTQDNKFDWECEIEDWLESNEPINSIIELDMN
ncbi:hypothetical protein ACPUVO_03095 [Pseudocolwellia sp. HL-MZ19]|jgi:hypothetical protein|uniref:hypothetical protein n=1 Tax=unclassified Pseudocolwellia TaxID=2848178 RepID=UPI003CECCD1F